MAVGNDLIAGRGPGDWTVLVVDDDDQIRALFAAVLARAGYTARTAADGPGALALFE